MEELLRIVVEEILKLLLGIISLSLTILVLVQRHQFNKFRKKVAFEQGVFNKPTLSLGMFSKYDISTFILAVPLSKFIWEIPFVVNILNVGDKAAEEVEIFFRTNKEFCYGGGGKATIGNLSVKNAKICDVHETGPFITVVSSLTNIHPKQHIAINFASSIRAGTIFPVETRVTSKDGVDLKVEWWIAYQFPLDLAVSQKELAPCSKRFNIQVIDTSDTDIIEFFNKYNEVLERQREKTYTKSTFLKRIKRNFQASSSREKIALISFEEQIKKKKTLGHSGQQEVTVYEVPAGALQVQEGLKFEDEYFIPNVTHEIKGNRLTKKCGRPPSSAAY